MGKEIEANQPKEGTLEVELDAEFLGKVENVAQIKGTATKDGVTVPFSFGADGTAKLELEAGTWEITVESDGYEPFSFEKTIVAGEVAAGEKVSLKYKERYVTVHLNGAYERQSYLVFDYESGEQKNSVFYLTEADKDNDRQIVFDKDENVKLEITPGEWRIEATCSGHWDSWYFYITVTDEQLANHEELHLGLANARVFDFVKIDDPDIYLNFKSDGYAEGKARDKDGNLHEYSIRFLFDYNDDKMTCTEINTDQELDIPFVIGGNYYLNYYYVDQRYGDDVRQKINGEGEYNIATEILDGQKNSLKYEHQYFTDVR